MEPHRMTAVARIFSWAHWFWPSLVVVLVCDHISKFWLFSYPLEPGHGFDPQHPGPIAGFPSAPLFAIDRSYNLGVAWSQGERHPLLVTLLTAVLIPVLAWVWWKQFRTAGRWENLAFGAILGGAFGNGIDRALTQAGQLSGVRDFISISLGFWPCNPWPTFNIADAGISVGFVILASLALFKPQPAASSGISPTL